jgi:ketosteroid isomerase-like protein
MRGVLMKKSRLGSITFLAMVLAACSSAPDPTAEMESLMEADRAFNRATAANGAAGWVSSFAEDGVMFRAGELVRGHEAIGEMMGPAFADPNFSLTWEPTHAEVSSAADLGYTIGRYESRRVGEAGDTVIGTGSYVSIWRRGDDGAWKVVLDIGSAAGEGM